MKNYKVALKGSFLPDIGGVSIHISRLAEALFKDGLLDCVYSTTKSSGYQESRFIVKNASYPSLRYDTFQSLYWFLKNYKKDLTILHLHGHPIWESPTIYLLLLFKKKVVFTIHDQMMLSNLDKYPRFFLYIFKKITKHKNIYWIAVSSKIKNQSADLITDFNNIAIIPAYLPAHSDNTPLNDEIEEFIRSRSKIISIYAHSIRNLNGKDLYGIDLALKAIGLVKRYYQNIGIIICIPNVSDLEQVESYKQIINEFQLFKNVLFLFTPLSNPIQLWQKSDVVLRPTLTDGDSLVVREAISQGTFVIASDVVNRPKEVILFKSENVEDLSLKIVQVLAESKKTINQSFSSNYELIKNIYACL